jgi:hypothetical protein
VGNGQRFVCAILFGVCSAFLCAFLCFASFPFVEMVGGLQSVIATYQERLMLMHFAPKHSVGRVALGVHGTVNKLLIYRVWFTVL